MENGDLYKKAELVRKQLQGIIQKNAITAKDLVDYLSKIWQIAHNTTNEYFRLITKENGLELLTRKDKQTMARRKIAERRIPDLLDAIGTSPEEKRELNLLIREIYPSYHPENSLAKPQTIYTLSKYDRTSHTYKT
jgi:hypothetical protein